MSLNFEDSKTRNRETASDFTWTLGVAQACDYRSILGAIATLIEAQRPDLALVLIEEDLKVRS